MAQRAAEAEKVIESGEAEEVILRLTTEKGVYRPGEAIVLRVTAINTTDEPIQMHMLMATTGPPRNARGSVTIWFGKESNTQRLQRFPVISRNEEEGMERSGGELIDLGPGEMMSRSFLMTQITGQPGDYVLQTHMEPFWGFQTRRMGKIYSNRARYRVYGEVLLERDTKGLIQMHEAINIAAAATPGEILLTDAILVDDDVGFYKWWVNVDYQDGNGQTQKSGYLVDPYQGRVWRRALPFPESMKQSRFEPGPRTQRMQSSSKGEVQP